MKHAFPILILLILVFRSTYGQSDSLFTITGDTLVGTIEMHRPDPMNEDITIHLPDDFKRRFGVTQFTGFSKDGQSYKVVKYNEKYRVMQVEMEGYLSLLT